MNAWRRWFRRQPEEPDDPTQADLDRARDAALAELADALAAVRAAMRHYARLATEAESLGEQIAFWEGRARAADSASLAGEAAARRDALAARASALQAALAGARPAYEQATSLLARLRQRETEIAATHGQLSAQRAAAEALLHLFGGDDAGDSALVRLRELEAAIATSLAHAEAARELESDSSPP